VQRIGILGGTFDPVHVGHLILGEEARIALQLDRVLFIPAAQPWRKAAREIAAPSHRLEMVRLAVRGTPGFKVSSIEIDRGGPTYTADTLESLHRLLPEAAFWFILGSDALSDLPNWREPARISAQSRLAVASRGEGDDVLAELERSVPGLTANIDQIPMPSVSISSSELRDRLHDGVSTRYWLPETVRRYILDHRLYGVRDGKRSGRACGPSC
jgi:nicotinate-nucleotide adenylyltransferase